MWTLENIAVGLSICTNAILMRHWFHNHTSHTHAFSARSRSICACLCYTQPHTLQREEEGRGMCWRFLFHCGSFISFSINSWHSGNYSSHWPVHLQSCLFFVFFLAWERFPIFRAETDHTGLWLSRVWVEGRGLWLEGRGHSTNGCCLWHVHSCCLSLKGNRQDWGYGLVDKASAAL